MHLGPLAAIGAYGLPAEAELPPAPLDPPGWTAFLAGVVEQRLTGLAVVAADAGDLVLTDEQREQLESEHWHAMAQVLGLERQLLRIAGSLESVGIAFRVLKGSAVAHLDYDDPSLRSFGDCDILVHPHDLDRAHRQFESLGYSRNYPAAADGFDERFGKGATYVEADGGSELDVHRTLAMGPFGLSIDLEQLWAAPRRFAVGGRELTALGPEQRFLHACFHATVGNPLDRLQPHRDVAEMLLHGSVDMDRVVQLAEGWQTGALVSRAVTRTWDMWGIGDEPPLVAWSRRRAVTAREERRLAVYRRDASYTAKCVECLAVIPRWRDRAAFVRYLAFPDPRFVGAHHPGSRRAWVWRGTRQAVRYQLISRRWSGHSLTSHEPERHDR